LSYPRALALAAAGARPIGSGLFRSIPREFSWNSFRKGRKIRSQGWNQSEVFAFSPEFRRETHMQEYQPQRLLTYGVDWRALLSWTIIIVAFSLLSLASVVLLP
jgi:hypothetical protein